MSTNQKWLFALNLLIFFKKRFVNFDKWGKWMSGPNFFSKIVKIKGLIPKFHFFFKKVNRKFAAVKKTKSLGKLFPRGVMVITTAHSQSAKSDFDQELKFDQYVNYLCKKAGQKLSFLVCIVPFVNIIKKRNIMKPFIECHFGYCPLICMFHSKGLNNKTNCIHERMGKVTGKHLCWCLF